MLLEGAAMHLDRRMHPEREAKRPRYKPVWQVAGILGLNVPVIAALFFLGQGAAMLVAAIVFGAYVAFSYRLKRSLPMQRRFLRGPLPPDVPPADDDRDR